MKNLRGKSLNKAILVSKPSSLEESWSLMPTFIKKFVIISWTIATRCRLLPDWRNSQLGNVGKARSRGIDLSGKVQHAFTPDLWMILNGTFTYSKATYRKIEEATSKPAWQRREGHELSQQIGYIAEGLFRDQAEINNSPTQGGDIMPGDIRYRDINEDGVIDVNDATYIGFPTTPRVIYGFSGFFNFKNIEFSFAFQGSGQTGFLYESHEN